ncbi:MAG: hypothetical protein Q9183_005987 [Haloplaca sp. 2 TL-2023]
MPAPSVYLLYSSRITKGNGVVRAYRDRSNAISFAQTKLIRSCLPPAEAHSPVLGIDVVSYGRQAGGQDGYWVEETAVTNIDSDIPAHIKEVHILYEQSSGMKLDDPRFRVESQKGALWSKDARVVDVFIDYKAAATAHDKFRRDSTSLDEELGSRVVMIRGVQLLP